jgi:hypothetical protein
MNVHAMPPRAYLDNISLSHLNTAELLLTATIRLYAQEARGKDGNGLDWHEGLLTAGVRPCAVVAFGFLLDGLLAASRGQMDIRCPLCPALGGDEGKILQLISLLQQQRFREAHAVLGTWLSPLEQGAMLSPATHIAFACAGQGLRVPWRHRETAMQEYFEVSCGDSGTNFVH